MPDLTTGVNVDKSPAIEIRESDLGPGTDVCDPAELVAQCINDPALDEAIRLAERAAGAVSHVRRMAHSEARRAVHDRRVIESNRQIINMGAKRQMGK